MGYSFKNDPHRKKKLAAIIVLLLFVGSSFAIAIIDALSFGIKRNEKQELPPKISYADLSPELKQAMIQNYYMIIEYTYPESCVECNATITTMGAFAQDKIDLYIIAMKGNTHSAVMYNAQDEIMLNSTSHQELFDNYCKITFNTYSQCALTKI